MNYFKKIFSVSIFLILLTVSFSQLTLNQKLYNAVSAGDELLVKKLILSGADVNSLSDSDERTFYKKEIIKKTPLHIAAEKNYVNMIKILLKNGAHIEKPFLGYITPVITAAENNSIEALKYLIKKGADYKKMTNYADVNENAFLAAVTYNNEDIVKYFIEDLNYYCNIKRTFTTFAKNNNFEMMKWLYERFSNEIDVDYEWNLPLSISLGPAILHAAKNNNFEMVKWLTEHGADPNVKGYWAMTALIYACKNDNFEMVKYLVEHDADVNIKTEQDGYPIHNAYDRNIQKYLLSKGADINSKGRFEMTLIEVLILYGIKVTYSENLNSYIISDNTLDRMFFLLNNGADTKNINIYGNNIDDNIAKDITEIFCQYGYKTDSEKEIYDGIKEKLKEGNPNLKNIYGIPYAFMAVGNNELMNEFLSEGLDPDIKDNFGRTLIYVAEKKLNSEKEKEDFKNLINSYRK